MSDPLVWLPFEPAELGDPPAGLRYEVVRIDHQPRPESAAEVEFVVAPYQLGKASADLFAGLPALRVVQTLSAGVEHIQPAIPDGVLLCNGRGIHDTSTAELALALILASRRDVPAHVRAQEEGHWRPRWGRSIADTRVLIVGYGQIGAAIERRLVPFECEVVRVARHARQDVHAVDELPTLLPDADIVVLIVPGTAQTTGLLGADLLARMKDGALLVNLARGSVVDTDALLAELAAERLYAALDVTDPEPLPPEHPLWSAPNVLITPHVGGLSTAMWPRAHQLVREQLQRYAEGEPVVNQMTGDY